MANEIIFELCATGRKATKTELITIITHVAQAPFATYVTRVPEKLREALAVYGIQAPNKQSSLEQHLLKRIYVEKQWPIGASVERYVTDLHQAILHPSVKLWTYHYYHRPYAGFMAPSHVFDASKPLPQIYVVYDPAFGVITTGYQATSPETVFDEHCTNIVQHQ